MERILRADVVVECAGASASVRLCFELVKKLGQYTQVGIQGSPLELDIDQIVMKQLRVQGSMCHTWETWDHALAFLGQGRIDLKPLISERLPLSRWEEGFNRVMGKEGAKFLLYPD